MPLGAYVAPPSAPHPSRSSRFESMTRWCKAACVVFSLLWCSVGAAHAQREPSERDIRRGLQRYAHEPSVGALLKVVQADRAFDPTEARRIARRARRGGWLPTLRLAARRGQARDLSQSGIAADPRLSTDDDLTVEGSLSIRLDRAVYGPDEVALSREERSRAIERQQRAAMVVAAYFERRRLQLERDLSGRRDVATFIRIRELGALLDAFTSGAFTRMMRRSRR